MQNIRIINLDGYLKAVEKCNNGQFGELDPKDVELTFKEIKPINGYKPHINNETGQQHPNCCNWHKYINEQASKWFEKFPNCCKWHEKLIGQPWFDKDNYKDVVNKIITQLSYTEYCILKNIDKPDWYDAITDYIEWNISSFGRLPEGYGNAIGLNIYYSILKGYINHPGVKMPKDKRKKLNEYLHSYIEVNKNKAQKPDLNVLKQTYEKWFKIFPFEISFFSHLKPLFEKRLPILEEIKVNRYSKVAKAKIVTKNALIDVLISRTNTILTQINTLALYEKGLLTEPQKVKLELIVSERRSQLKKGYKNAFKSEEKRYRKMLKKWFEDEKKFIDEITPILKDIPPQETETESKQPHPDHEKILAEIKNSENQLWKGLPMDEVVKHFEVMTTTKSKNGNVFLTTEQLISFLKKGFLKDESQPKQKINCSAREKGFVLKRFYELYDLAVSKYGYPQRTEPFINLFIHCFDNWKDGIKSYFKPNKIKRKW